MLKYIEINRNTEGDHTMQAKLMYAKRKNQFAVGFVMAALFPFLLK